MGEHKFWYKSGAIYEIDSYQNGKLARKVQYHESGGEWFVYEFSGNRTTMQAYEEDGTLNHTEIFDYDAGTVKFIQANGDCEIWEIDGSKIGDC
jgi:antitoxin component YwqK of YwqJK toxin-antitoxin module